MSAPPGRRPPASVSLLFGESHMGRLTYAGVDAGCARTPLSASADAESREMKSVRHAGAFGSDQLRSRRCNPWSSPPTLASITLSRTRSVATVASSDASASRALYGSAPERSRRRRARPMPRLVLGGGSSSIFSAAARIAASIPCTWLFCEVSGLGKTGLPRSDGGAERRACGKKRRRKVVSTRSSFSARTSVGRPERGQ
mmetsp:Transcript_18300/g.41185  ORF Transcript_18300/g.41185 Transcript_18300/m.41185 type:complete len:200 (+) Transcript_18300:324-923(+)